MDPIIVECPHCHLCVEIVEINCAIFRHGINNIKLSYKYIMDMNTLWI